MKKRPWVKLWRKTMGDEKISFLLARHGHDVFTVWTFLLLSAEDDTGMVEIDTEYFSFCCHVQEERLQEILQILSHPRRALIRHEEGIVQIINWEEYQYTDSTERMRKLRKEGIKDKKETYEDLVDAEEPEETENPCDGDVTSQGEGCDGDVTSQGEGCDGDVASQSEGCDVTKGEDVTPLLRSRVEGRYKRVEYINAAHQSSQAFASDPDPPSDLYQEIWSAFLDKNGQFSNYGKEGKAVKGLIEKAMHRAREPTLALDLLRQMMGRFWELKTRGGRFWREQPFLPSAMNSSGIFDRVLETFRETPMKRGAEEVLRLMEEEDDSGTGPGILGSVLLPVSGDGPAYREKVSGAVPIWKIGQVGQAVPLDRAKNPYANVQRAAGRSHPGGVP